jgi:hypothetical protein
MILSLFALALILASFVLFLLSFFVRVTPYPLLTAAFFLPFFAYLTASAHELFHALAGQLVHVKEKEMALGNLRFAPKPRLCPHFLFAYLFKEIDQRKRRFIYLSPLFLHLPLALVFFLLAYFGYASEPLYAAALVQGLALGAMALGKESDFAQAGRQ